MRASKGRRARGYGQNGLRRAAIERHLIECHRRHMDVPAAEGGERRGKITLLPLSLSASGRSPSRCLNQFACSRLIKLRKNTLLKRN
jgi:hypothetical protein